MARPPGYTGEPWLLPLPSGFIRLEGPGDEPGLSFLTVCCRVSDSEIESERVPTMPGKRVQFDDETFAALDMLARDRMMDFQELADEAFRDLLKKHGRPASLKEALQRSAGQSADVVPFRRKPAPKKTKKKRR